MKNLRDILSIAIPAQENLFSISEIYHENTKLRRYQSSKRQQIDAQIIQEMPKAFKTYRTAKRFLLKREFDISQYSLEEVIQQRRSIRHFSGEGATLEELAKLLYLGNGVTGSLQNGNVAWTLRAAPSAGALYPIEMYPITLNVRGISPGIYHYNVREHALELLKEGDYREILYSSALEQEMLLSASVVILLTAIFVRTRSKYGERGYRYVFLDAGHVGENIYLVATAMGFGVVSVGGFYDDELNQLLYIDGVNEAVVYILVLGKRRHA
jgi:SagB-type dehydrogenase family enzyme